MNIDIYKKIIFSHLFWLDSHLLGWSDYKHNEFECVFLPDLHINHSNTCPIKKSDH